MWQRELNVLGVIDILSYDRHVQVKESRGEGDSSAIFDLIRSLTPDQRSNVCIESVIVTVGLFGIAFRELSHKLQSACFTGTRKRARRCIGNARWQVKRTIKSRADRIRRELNFIRS